VSELACQTELRAEQQRNSRVTLGKLLLIIPVMLVFCASMVPLYRQICEVMGISASKAVAQNSQVDTSRTVRVEFDAGVNRNFKWQFTPVDKQVEINPGAVVTTGSPHQMQGGGASIGHRGRALFSEAGMLLLQQPDLAAWRNARHAGYFFCRPETAERHRLDRVVLHVF
jgi:hypothetical protein